METNVNTWLAVLSPPQDVLTRLVKGLGDEIARERAEQARLKRLAVKACPTPGCDQPRKVRKDGSRYAYCEECCRLNMRRFRETVKGRGGRESERQRRKRLGLCAVYGCNAERYTYPGGNEASRCKDHINLWKAGIRNNGTDRV